MFLRSCGCTRVFGGQLTSRSDRCISHYQLLPPSYVHSIIHSLYSGLRHLQLLFTEFRRSCLPLGLCHLPSLAPLLCHNFRHASHYRLNYRKHLADGAYTLLRLAGLAPSSSMSPSPPHHPPSASPVRIGLNTSPSCFAFVL